MRAARSSRRTAALYAFAAASAVLASRTRFTAVRRAERCARLRVVRVRDWRRAFFAQPFSFFARVEKLIDPADGLVLVPNAGQIRRVQRLQQFFECPALRPKR